MHSTGLAKNMKKVILRRKEEQITATCRIAWCEEAVQRRQRDDRETTGAIGTSCGSAVEKYSIWVRTITHELCEDETQNIATLLTKQQHNQNRRE